VTGAGSTGLLCPECDADYHKELRELGAAS